MAFDASRKTLDDIRRELDAEYPHVTDAPTQADVPQPLASDVNNLEPRSASAPVPPYAPDARAATDDVDGSVPPRRHPAVRFERSRSYYIVAGAIGFLLGQLTLVGYIAMERHRAASNVLRAEAPSAHVWNASVPNSGVEPPSTSETAIFGSDRGDAVTTSQSFVPSASLTTPKSNLESDVGVPDASVGVAQSPAAPLPLARGSKQLSQRPVKKPTAAALQPQPVSVPRSEPTTDRMRSERWAELQDQVRTALSEWLAASGRADRGVVSDTIVFMGADGLTARTHVPVRSSGGVVIREQRWQLRATGWSLIEDKEAWMSRE